LEHLNKGNYIVHLKVNDSKVVKQVMKN